MVNVRLTGVEKTGLWSIELKNLWTIDSVNVTPWTVVSVCFLKWVQLLGWPGLFAQAVDERELA